jgi:hypothetical protein
MDRVRAATYTHHMGIPFSAVPDDGQRFETQAEREDRIRQEAATIDRARAEIAAGHGLDDAALEAWLDALEHDPQAPVPRPLTARR